MTSTPSPYLSNSRRLADVLAALQVMGAYSYASRRCEAWAEKLGAPLSSNGWNTVFVDHPEFFHVHGEWVSLRWRHGYDRMFSPVLGRELTREEFRELSEDQKDELTRMPLASDQIETLMKTAIELHSREVAFNQERRWLSPLLFGLLGIVVGTVLHAALK